MKLATSLSCFVEREMWRSSVHCEPPSQEGSSARQMIVSAFFGSSHMSKHCEESKPLMIALEVTLKESMKPCCGLLSYCRLMMSSSPVRMLSAT